MIRQEKRWGEQHLKLDIPHIVWEEIEEILGMFAERPNGGPEDKPYVQTLIDFCKPVDTVLGKPVKVNDMYEIAVINPKEMEEHRANGDVVRITAVEESEGERIAHCKVTKLGPRSVSSIGDVHRYGTKSLIPYVPPTFDVGKKYWVDAQYYPRTNGIHGCVVEIMSRINPTSDDYFCRLLEVQWSTTYAVGDMVTLGSYLLKPVED